MGVLWRAQVAKPVLVASIHRGHPIEALEVEPREVPCVQRVKRMVAALRAWPRTSDDASTCPGSPQTCSRQVPDTQSSSRNLLVQSRHSIQSRNLIMSRNLKNALPPPQDEVDGRWEGARGAVLVEVKKTHSMRDVRDVFLALAYRLSAEPASSTAVCVLVESRLSASRLQEEMRGFRAVIHPKIANRVNFLLAKGSPKDKRAAAFSGSMQSVPGEFGEWLGELVANVPTGGHAPQLAPRQLVVAALAQLRLWSLPPVTVKSLQEACRVSYPTVAAVLKGIGRERHARGVWSAGRSAQALDLGRMDGVGARPREIAQDALVHRPDGPGTTRAVGKTFRASSRQEAEADSAGRPHRRRHGCIESLP